MRLSAALLLATLFCSQAYGAEAPIQFQRLFHLAGIPGVAREQRVDLTASSEGLTFATSKVTCAIPYSRIRGVLMLSADRRYEGRTYLLALATYGVGSLAILKKHHVDTVVLDYVNERGGKMGIVVQIEPDQGERFASLLKSKNIHIDEPDVMAEPPTATGTGTSGTEGSKK